MAAVIILVMGVAGAGKTTIGRLLAEALGFAFADADAFHPAANVAKMSRGMPLTDADRAPWLDALASAIDQWIAGGCSVVLACSALRQSYRRRLLRDPWRTRLVYLKASPELLRARLEQRVGHFAKSDLLKSQLDTLEEPDDAVTVDVTAPPEAVVAAVRAGLGVHEGAPSSEADDGSR
jgi:gluconokinase